MRIHLLFLAALCLPLHAQSTLYWDGDGSGTVGGKSGTWSTALARWSTSATGSTYQVWSSTSPTDHAVFQNTADTVTLGSNVTARSLTFGTTGYTITGPFALTLDGGNGTIDTGSGNQSISAIIAGRDGLTKSGTGALLLTGANIYTGDTTVESGTLTLGSGSSISHSTNDLFIGNTNTGDVGTLQLTGGTLSNNNATIGNAAGSQGSATVTSGTWTNAGSLWVGYSGTGGLLVDGGTITSSSAVLGFTGTTGNGSVTVSSGSWTNSGSLLVGRAGAGNLTVNSGGLVTVEGITYTGFYGGSTGAITLSGTSGNRGTLATNQIVERSGSGTVTFDGGILQARADESAFIANYESGDVTINAGGAFIDSNGFAISISSPLNGTGSLTKQGAGTLTLSGTNSYTGRTVVNSGTLTLGAGGSISHPAAQTFIGNGNGDIGTLQLSGGTLSNTNATIGNAAGSQGSATVTSGTWTNSGTLWVGYSGTGSFLVDGGTVTSASAVLGFTGTIGSGSATVTSGSWTNASDLLIGRAGSGSLTVSSGGFVSVDSITYTGFYGGSMGSITLTGTTGNRGTLSTLQLAEYQGAGTVTFDGGILQARVDESDFISNYESGDVTIDSGGAFIDSNGFAIGISSSLGGTGGLTKQGTGTLTLSGTNTYSGGTTISAGTLQGSSSSLQGNITNNAGLVFDQSNNGTYSDAISGSGSFSKTGSGTLSLSGTNSYAGGTNVEAGTLALGHATDTLANTGAVEISGGTLALGANSDTVGALSLSAGSITGSGGTLTAPSYAFTNTGSVSAHLAGSGTLTKTGGGTLTLSSANTYTGGTTINAGTLAVSGTGSISHPSNALAVNSNAILEIAAGGSVANGRGDLGRVYGLNTATADISGTWTNSSDLYVGYLARASLTVRAGGTVANSTGRVGYLAYGSADISGIWTNSSALIVGSGSNGDLTVKDGGLVNVGSGSGTITLANSSAYSGTLNISGSATPGILNTASVAGGAGTAILNFNHTNSDYHFSTDGTATGTAVAITGSTSVNHLGTGTTTLSGTNSNTGRTTVISGTLAQGTSAAFAPNTAYTVNGGTLDLNDFDLTASSLSGAGGSVDLGTAKLTADQSGNSAYAGTISGTSGSITKQGAGTLTLSGTNTHTGGTTVNSGLINFASGDNLGTAAITLDGGGLQWAAGNTLDISNRLDPLGAAGGTFDTNGNLVTLATAMTGTGGLTKQGAGTLTLSGINTYSGGTTVSAGTLQGNSTSLQGNILNHAAVDFDQASNGIYAGVMSGTGTLTKTGAGTLNLNGTNTYTGVTTISAGTLVLGHATDTLADLYGNVAITGGTLDLGANSDLVGTVSMSSGGITGSGTLTAGGSYTFTNSGSVSADLAGANGITKTGAGTVTLSGTNTYTGGTIVSAGTLAVTGTGSIADPLNAVFVGQSNGDAGTLEIANGGSVSSFQGVLGAGSGSMGTADISGTWTNSDLLHIGESGTGSLTVRAGGTVSNSNGVLGKNSGSSGTADIAGTWNNSGRLKVGVVGNGSLTVQAGGTVSSISVQLGGDDNASATADIAGTWNIGADLRMGDDGGNGSLLTVQAGGILSSGSADIGGVMVTTVSTDNPDTVNIAGTWNTGQVMLGWGAHGTLAVQNGGRVNVTSGRNIRLGDGLSGGRGTINIEGTTAAGVLNTDSVHGNPDAVGYGSQNKVAVLNFNHTDSDYHFTTDGETTGTAVAITGATAVNHLGTGTTTLSGTNTYTGGTTVSAGTLRGTSTSLQGDIINNASLIFDQSPSGTYSSAISGTGGVTKLGTGTLTLSGTNTYSGGTTISAGTLQGSSSSLQGNITNNAGLVFDQSFNGTYAGEISGTDGSVSKLGAGTLTLSGNNTYTGGTTVSSGTLSLANNNAAGSGQVTVNGGTLHINEGISPTNAISLAGGSVARDFGSGASLINATNVTSALAGGTDTTVVILGGTTSTSTTLSASFAALIGAENDSIRQSDVLSLSGVPVVNISTGQTDLFVLQLQVGSMDAESFLGWLDPETNAWVNAVDGNFGGTSTFLGDAAYNPGTDFVLGYYGIDTASNSVWAVINHNSEFSVVVIPEPSAFAMLGCALGGMLLLRRRA